MPESLTVPLLYQLLLQKEVVDIAQEEKHDLIDQDLDYIIDVNLNQQSHLVSLAIPATNSPDEKTEEEEDNDYNDETEEKQRCCAAFGWTWIALWWLILPCILLLDVSTTHLSWTHLSWTLTTLNIILSGSAAYSLYISSVGKESAMVILLPPILIDIILALTVLDKITLGLATLLVRALVIVVAIPNIMLVYYQHTCYKVNKRDEDKRVSGSHLLLV